eukprot:g8696.t2
MTSEFHKQEALQSLEVARKALKEKNIEKAKRFASKAQKLCNCPEVEEFIKKLTSATATPSSSSSSSSNAGPNLRKRASKTTNGEQGTEEQRLLISKIKRAKDYYEILEISKEASEDDIKRSYKKLALKLHPDKNKASGAEEAFKAVSRAFSCLSDEEKRNNYDTYGTEDRAQVTRPTYYQHQGFQDDFDPQEIFNMFFGGQFPMHETGIYRTYYHRPFPRHTPPDQDGQTGTTDGAGLKTLIRFLPLLFLLAFSLFSSGPTSTYSLYRDYNYSDKVVTALHHIPFYVKSKTQFERSYPEGTLGRQQLENQVLTFMFLFQNRTHFIGRRHFPCYTGSTMSRRKSKET